MFGVIARGGRPMLGALLLGTVFSISSPVFAACDVTAGTADVFQCTIQGVNIQLSGPKAAVTLEDYILDPTTSGYVRILANDSAASPTDITVDITGQTNIHSPDYDGVDVRTVRGDITLNIGDQTIIDAAQTAVFVESNDPNGGASYDGGSVVINNYGQITTGPNGGVMGSNGIVGRTNGGGVTINNYGTVTTSLTQYSSWDTYGILADGGGNTITPVEVSIYNDGTVSSLNDALRVNSYNGLGKVVNDVNGVLTSSGRRGVVVWSASNAAELENYGSITALDGTGANVWGDTGASAINTGTISAFNDSVLSGGPSTYVGAHVWAQTTGDAVLDNRSTGRIVARDGFGVWMQSTAGDVKIDNAGLIKGQYNAVMVTGDNVQSLTTVPLETYQGAQGGKITLNNTGILTASGLAENGIAGRGLVTLAGVDLSEVKLHNEAGGLIGAGIDLSQGFDSGLLDGSATELAALSPASSNLAVVIAAQTSGSGINVVNDGTILGRVVLGNVHDVFGSGPTSLDSGTIVNDGLWITSGQSVAGVVQNAGTVWALGQTSLIGALGNAGGTLVIAATSDQPAGFSITGDYAGGGVLALDLGSGGASGSNVMFDVDGDASGVTKLTLQDMSGWDWQSGESRDVIAVRGDSQLGEGSFALGSPYHGIVEYGLTYGVGQDEIWTLQALGVSDEATGEVADIAEGTAASLADVTSGAMDRTTELRKLFNAAEDVQPMGYAEPPTNPIDAAFAALKPDAAPALRAWAEAQGSLGSADTYTGQQATLHFGADISGKAGDLWLAGGVFGAMVGKGLDFDSGNTADITGGAIGVYGTAETADGLFVSGVYAVETASADIGIFSEFANFDALLHGGQVDAGFRTAIGDVTVEPSVGLRFGRVTYDDFAMSGTTVSTDDTDTYGAEARLQLSRTFVTEGLDVTPFATVALGNSASTGGDITVDGVGIVDALSEDGLYGKLASGVQVSSADGKFHGFALAESTLSDSAVWGSVKVGGSVGF